MHIKSQKPSHTISFIFGLEFGFQRIVFKFFETSTRIPEHPNTRIPKFPMMDPRPSAFICVHLRSSAVSKWGGMGRYSSNPSKYLQCFPMFPCFSVRRAVWYSRIQLKSTGNVKEETKEA
jgi:hypothetical protein